MIEHLNKRFPDLPVVKTFEVFNPKKNSSELAVTLLPNSETIMVLMIIQRNKSGIACEIYSRNQILKKSLLHK